MKTEGRHKGVDEARVEGTVHESEGLVRVEKHTFAEQI